MAIFKSYVKGDHTKLRDLKFKDTGDQLFIEKKEGFNYNQLNSRFTDVERFAKLLTSKPGLKFQANQALLQQVDTVGKLKKAATGGFKNLAKAVGKQALKTATNNIAKTASILAQVPVNGTGTHFLINISPDTYLSDGAGPTTGLGQFLRDQGIGGGVNGAKSALAGESIGTPNGKSGGLLADSILEGNEKETLLSRQHQLSSPTVNPIQLGASKLPDLSKKFLSKNKPSNVPNLSNDFTEYLGKEIIDGDITSPPTLINIEVAKDRKILEEKLNSSGTETSKVNTETVVPLPDDEKIYKVNGKKWTESNSVITIYNPGKKREKSDKASRPDPIQSLDEQTKSILGSNNKDIIPFEFRTFGNNLPKYIYFRALLSSLSDNYSSEWEPIQYVGRGDKFYTYSGFDRNITFSFKVAAFSKADLHPMYRKLNLLAAATAPSYSTSGDFMRGTFCKLTIGDYLVKQDGFFESVGIQWQTNYPWELNLENDNTARVPHILDIDISFKPIHKFNPTSDPNLNNSNKYIGGSNRLVQNG